MLVINSISYQYNSVFSLKFTWYQSKIYIHIYLHNFADENEADFRYILDFSRLIIVFVFINQVLSLQLLSFSDLFEELLFFNAHRSRLADLYLINSL